MMEILKMLYMYTFTKIAPIFEIVCNWRYFAEAITVVRYHLRKNRAILKIIFLHDLEKVEV